MHNCDCPFCDAGRSTFNVRRNPDEDDAPYRIKYFRSSVPDPLYLGPYDTHEDALDKYMQLMSRKGVISAVIEPICEFCASPHCDPDAGWACDESVAGFDSDEFEPLKKNPVPYSEASHGMCVDCFQGVLPARVLKSRNEELRAHGITVYCAWCKQIIYDPNIDHIYRRNPDKDYVFLGPCDRLRMAGNETKWQEMMHHKTPISAEEFGQACALKTLLEDDETLWDFVAGDPDSGFYTSIWGGQPCMFIQTHGFEFIFIPQ